MRKFLPRNDHVRNKDRHDPAAVISLADEKLIEYLRQLDFVSHTIIPEMDHFIEHKSVGMFSHPINIAVGSFSSLLFLILNQETGRSNLYMAQLHNPVRKVEVLKESVSYISLSPSIVSYKTGILYAFPKSHRILRWKKNSNEVDVFAGTGTAGNMGGMATRVLSASFSLCSIA